MAAALMLRTISGSTFDGSKRCQSIVSRVQWPIVRGILSNRRLSIIKRPPLRDAMGLLGKRDRFFRVSSESTTGVKGLSALQVLSHGQFLLGRGLFGVGSRIDQIAFGGPLALGELLGRHLFE